MPSRILYWKGCMSRIKTRSIADASEALLHILKVDYDSLGQAEGCCGSVLLRTGQSYAARNVAIATIERIRSGGYAEVVTNCPGCYKTMSSDYPQLILCDVPFKVRHISQLLYEQAPRLKSLLHPLSCRVIYHDPCHLGRHMGVYEEPRALIRMVPGVELVEFKYNREKSMCCGSGGGVRSVFPEIAREVSISLLADVPQDVDMLITSCPFCKYNISESRSSGIAVLDLPEFLLKSCRGA